MLVHIPPAIPIIASQPLSKDQNAIHLCSPPAINLVPNGTHPWTIKAKEKRFFNLAYSATWGRYKKHGYPPGYEPRRASSSSQPQAHNAVRNGVETDKHKSESQTSFARSTQDQVNQILQLIPQNTTAYAQANAAGMASLLSINRHDNTWILDTGATNHMTHNKNWLSKIQKAGNARVQLPNGKFYNVESIGHYKFLDNKALDNVLHIPNFKFNLLLVSKLTKDLSCYVIFFPKFVILQDLLSGKVLGNVENHQGFICLILCFIRMTMLWILFFRIKVVWLVCYGITD